MTAEITTPCQTGQLCLVPKRRNELLDQIADLKSTQANPAVAIFGLERQIRELEESCPHETHPDDWFEDPGAGYGTPAYWRSARARARCVPCPIRLECLGKGLQTEDLDHGVWGSYTAAQRAEIQKLRTAFEEGRIKEKEDTEDAETQSPQQEPAPAGS